MDKRINLRDFSMLIALILQVLPLPDWLSVVRPSFVALVVVYWGIYAPHAGGIFAPWLAGVALDVFKGDVLGQKLAALGRSHQVICVTHLPQVASYARHHWTIRKFRRGSRTVTQIAELKEPERLEELASMLRGEARGETTRREAAAMLAAAKGRW